MKGYHEKHIKRLHGNQSGNPVGLHIWRSGKGVVNRRVKFVWGDNKEEVTLEKLNDKIQRKEDGD